MGIDGDKEDQPITEVQYALAAIVEQAINAALTIYASPLGIGDNEVIGIALGAAEGMSAQFDIVPKGDEEHAICKYDPYFAEPSRGSYIGGWVPVSERKQADR